MDGIELVSRFSYITNDLCYCGPQEAAPYLLEYIKHQKGEEEVKKYLKRFEGLYPYLKLLAKKAGKDETDYEVVEAYWLGNSLTDKFSKDDMIEFIEELVKRGLVRSLADKLIKNMPVGAIPHHTFHVIYIGVGNIAHTIETNLDNMNNCRISAAKVLQIMDDLLVVSYRPLVSKDGKLILGEEETFSAKYDEEFLPSIKEGDYVALHWGFACLKLSEEQRNNLEKFTSRILDVINL